MLLAIIFLNHKPLTTISKRKALQLTLSIQLTSTKETNQALKSSSQSKSTEKSSTSKVLSSRIKMLSKRSQNNLASHRVNQGQEVKLNLNAADLAVEVAHHPVTAALNLYNDYIII